MIPNIMSNFLITSYEPQENISLAKELCNKSEYSISKFQKENIEKLLSLVAYLDSYHKYGEFTSNAKLIKLKMTDGDYIWNEESSEIYHWIILRIQSLSCNYTGQGPFIHFLYSSLFNSWTKTDFIRHSTKNTSYIPSYIKKRGDDYKLIYLFLTRYKPNLSDYHFIKSHIDLEFETTIEIINEIVHILKSKNKLYKIEKKNKLMSLDQILSPNYKDSITKINDPINLDLSPELAFDHDLYIEFMSIAFNNLSISEQWLLKSILVSERNAKELFKLLSKNKIMRKHKKELKINSSRSIYSSFDSIIVKLFDYLIKHIDNSNLPCKLTTDVTKNWLNYHLNYMGNNT